MTRELVFYLNPSGPDRRAIMHLLAAKGVRRIGLDGFPWHPERDRGQYECFKADLASAGLSVHSMHAVPPLVANGDGAPDDLLSTIRADLERLAAAGGQTAVYHACWMRNVPPERFDVEIGRVGWAAFRSTFAATVAEVARQAARWGITVVLENVWHSRYASSMAPILEIVGQVREANVGVCLDAGHAHLAGRVVADEIRAAGAWLKDMHFHDNVGPVGGAFPDQHIPPGLGTINWQDACRALNEIGYAGPVVFEGVLGPGDSIANGRFGGALSHDDLIEITRRNWRAFEALAG